ncbi:MULTISPECIES: hypothetical protein [Gemella]|uniref:hypothetical protein n=1 Tax=Gemella TaxID=1378 RepID=UPI00076837F5|nr:MULTISPECIES: hypothetical protein [Gemella]AME08806.1 hypothetical protein AXE85_00650 [Gemella sp. oral taxon 928]AXI26376.1 hypothetical protein CG018_02410 [Gemella sp. ND 6198]
MVDKKLIFLAISMLITVVALVIIIGTTFIDNEKMKNILIAVGFVILIVQKIVEIIVIKETRKVSFVILGVIIIAAAYLGYRLTL